VTNLLLKFGADHDAPTADGRTPLHWAAKHGHAEVVRKLIQHGANPAAQTSDGRTPLHWAASRGHETVSKTLLLDAHVNAETPDDNGWTALHWAACSGERAVVDLVLDAGLESFKASQEGISLNGGNSKGHEAVASLLLNMGVSPHTRNKDGQTALHWAAASGNDTIIKLLLAHGADPNAQDIYGSAPLHFAAENGTKGPIETLLSAGACRTLTTRCGWSALDLAKRGRRISVAETLSN